MLDRGGVREPGRQDSQLVTGEVEHVQVRKEGHVRWAREPVRRELEQSKGGVSYGTVPRADSPAELVLGEVELEKSWGGEEPGGDRSLEVVGRQVEGTEAGEVSEVVPGEDPGEVTRWEADIGHGGRRTRGGGGVRGRKPRGVEAGD